MARRVIDIEISELGGMRDRIGPEFTEAVERIRAAVERRGKVIVVGVGKSGHIGGKIAATLTSTGCPAVVLDSLNALHGDLGIVSDGDAVLALSYSGETEELNNILPAIARFDTEIIAMTGNPESMLARHSHVCLDVGIREEACPLKLAPTSSTTAMLVMGDALAMVLLEMRGFRKEDFAKFHPGGSLGRNLLLKVADIMRSGDAIVKVAPGASVNEVLARMTSSRAGAAVVVDPDGLLLGIFTHGDFARHFQSDPMLGSKPVGEFMTRGPVVIPSDALAVEVLHMLERERIDDLVVVDVAGRPVGVVDSQDLARFKLV